MRSSSKAARALSAASTRSQVRHGSRDAASTASGRAGVHSSTHTDGSRFSSHPRMSKRPPDMQELYLPERPYQTEIGASTAHRSQGQDGSDITVHVHDANGVWLETISGASGGSLLDLLNNNDFNIEAACDGQLACATCAVKFEPKFHEALAKRQPVSEDEAEMLGSRDLMDCDRLSCALTLTPEMHNMTLRLPRSSAGSAGSTLKEDRVPMGFDTTGRS